MLPDPRPYFADIPDPRRKTRNKLHKLQDIVMITLCAIISGVEDWVGIELFAEEREAWLRGFLELPNGIPSHDTLSDVMGRIKPEAFSDAFIAWVNAALPDLSGEHIAIDGKTLRGSRQSDVAQPNGHAVHLMSAFATQARLVLCQHPVSDKGNEITAIPTLLDMLDVSGAVVSIDAIGCQKSVAQKITDCGADYVLALKENHPQLSEDVQLWLDSEENAQRLTVHETVEKEHGRIETRRYVISDQIDWLEQKPLWAGLKAVGMVECVREVGEKTSIQRRYYLCSITELERFSEVVRGHWSIENSQHWVLDVQFGEDANRSRKDYSATNLALIRRMGLNFLRRAEQSKRSLRQRKMRACLNDNYRSHVLFGSKGT